MTKTLCLNCHEGGIGQWLPPDVRSIQDAIKNNASNIANLHKFSQNLSYNLQSIHFLDRLESELALTTVLKKMLWKNYIITAASIIEVIIYCYLVDCNIYKNNMKTKTMKMVKAAIAHGFLSTHHNIEDELRELMNLRNSVHINTDDLANGIIEYDKFTKEKKDNAEHLLRISLQNMFPSNYTQNYWP